MVERDDAAIAAERARLEAIAYGPTSTVADAARARIALSDLARVGLPRRPGLEARPASAPSAPADGVLATGHGADDAEPVTTDQVPGPSVPVTGPAGPGRANLQAERAVDEVDEVDDARRASTPDDHPAPQRRFWSARRRWLAAGALAAVALGFAGGIGVGTVRSALPAAPTPSPTDGAITLTRLLDAPQTYADQLPGAIEVPVVLHSTRLVFTNRSLAGDDANTPWNVWAGVGKDRTQVCLIASADRIQATAGCYPKEAVLAGNVSLTAQSMSGVLIVRVVGGVVEGTVTNSL